MNIVDPLDHSKIAYFNPNSFVYSKAYNNPSGRKVTTVEEEMEREKTPSILDT